ncbi:hypothetical protein LXL04_039060 [Taraxacum kok-saghyz]
MIPHNRGRGGYPNRGGRGRGQYPLFQHGSNRLIAKNVSSNSASSSSVPIPGDSLYEDFQKYLKEKGINNPQSYTQAITEGDNIEDTSEYIQSPYKEEILLLENKDVIKAIIKRIISVEDWGLSTLRERELTMPESKTIKNIPVWFLKWWISYGPSIDILPENPFRTLYGEWLPVSPKYKEAITQIKGPKEVIEVIYSLHFFIEISIPWIWKWVPQVDYSPNKFSSLQKLYLTKFWPKMLQRDQETK